MPAADTETLRHAVGAVLLPGLDCSLEQAGTRISLQLAANGEAQCEVTLGFNAGSLAPDLVRDIKAALTPTQAQVKVLTDIRSHAVQGQLKPLPGIRNVIAVASGKGGVGKSTTAVNLALALQADGARVGILDADIYGPSQPTLLGIAGQRPVSKDGKTFEPLLAHGLQVISIGFLVDQAQAVIWRGPMVTQALQQMLFQTNWRDLDYLIVDLPPGTGDTQLTLTQKVPLSGAVIITTPQDIALLDARRGLQMFEKVSVPVLGVIENMSSYVCPECGHEEALFGAGGGDTLARESAVPVLGQVPLDIRIRTEADEGCPTVAAEPEGELTRRYQAIARRLALELARRPVDHKGAFPDIVVEGA
ncbi:MAG: iron-sulfur cluster carrier protein ApbC [Gammaproteobacteria bacterium]